MKNILFILSSIVSFSSFGQTAQEYIYSGNEKAKTNDYYGAISDYTKAIELYANYGKAYKNRSIAKKNLGDLNGACKDWGKAAELGDTDTAEWVANQCN